MPKLACLTIVLSAMALTWSWAAGGGPVGHWRFAGPGPQIEDLSGKGHTATVTGGKVLTEDGRGFLRCDGRTRVEVPSAPDLNLGKELSIETRIRPSDLSDGRLLVAKEDEYMLRVDWVVESSRLSFFVKLSDGWEPRVSAFKPPLDAWYHIVAVWDNSRLQLWVNGLPHSTTHRGDLPPPTAKPLLIGGGTSYGKPFVGDIEYVKVYNRALTSSEVIQAAYSVGATAQAPPTTASSFDFRQGAHDWVGREGADVSTGAAGLTVRTKMPTALAIRDNLEVNVDQRDYLTVRMAVDRGSRGNIIFITEKGGGQVPFPTIADGRLHTYVLEPWEYTGWGGKLVALGVAPAETEGARATVQYVRVTEEPEGEGEIELLAVYPEAALPRAGRPERIMVRLRNNGGPAEGLQVRLRAPRGVALRGPATETLPAIGYQEERELCWSVQAEGPVTGDFRAEVTGPGLAPADLTVPTTFQPALRLAKAAYVPEPVPATSDEYEIWTHYCPLWKHGTHMGWKAIEPYPDRKPVMGWFNEGEPEVADWHIKQMLEHGISNIVYCWYRSSINEPVKQNLGHAIHDGLLQAKYLPKINFTIMWENGCGAGAGSVEDFMTNVFPFWLDNYFTHPSYKLIDGKPLLYVWVPPNVTQHFGGSDKVKATFDLMRAKCRERGLKGLYIVGCMGAADRVSLERMAQEGWDASSAYGAGWSYPQKIRTVGDFISGPYEDFVVQQEGIWKGKDAIGALPDITAAMMGWDARPWNSSPFFWSANNADKFRDLCRRAKAVMAAKPTNGPEKKTIIFCCWNEFGEGHYIEPTRGKGYSYVDVIREEFTSAPKEHTDLAPEDVGLGPYDSWYQTAKVATMAGAGASKSAWRGPELAAWTGFMGLEKFEVAEGVLRMVTASADPALGSPVLEVRASKFSRVVVEMRVSQPGLAQLFWTTASQPRTEEKVSLHAKGLADGEFHRYEFPVGDTEFWGGRLTGMRFDPTDKAGVTVEVKAIYLE